MTATITFHGGAGTVTGANFLLDTGDKKILIDCGATQREHVCDEENLKPFVYNPADIDILLVTHAHQDHIGRIPKLVHDGFRGKIISTAPTRDLAFVMLEDALTVMTQEKEHAGCTPMYGIDDIDRTRMLWKDVLSYHAPTTFDDITVTLYDAGHILGAAMVCLERNDRRILFTGDLGNSPDLLLSDTEFPAGIHYMVMESVYGDRVHEDKETRVELLADVLQRVHAQHGTLLIPSFSLERTQILLYEIGKMVREGKVPALPVYLDAPLGTRVTEIFRSYPELFNADVREVIATRGDAFTFDGLHIVHTVGESREIHERPSPKVIIAGAGMSNGGRIRAHELTYLPDPHATILFVGYQAPGSLGRRIHDGARTVTIDEHTVHVRAQVESIGGFSGHKDRDGLMEFVQQVGKDIETVFVCMGEPKAELFLAQRIRDFLAINAQVPTQGQTVSINW